MIVGVGTPSVGGMDLFSRIDWIASHGFREIELYACSHPRVLAGVWLRALSAEGRARLAERLRSFELVDFHAPFQNTFDTTLVSPNPLVSRLSVEEITVIMEFAAEVSRHSVVTCHSGWAPVGVDEEEVEGTLVENLKRLSEAAVRTGVRVGLEVADYFMPADRFQLLEDLGLPMVGITLDTGHISFVVNGRHMTGRFGTIGRFIRHYAPLLYHVHLHDFDGEHDHLPLGRGGLDFEDIIGSLAAIGYDGAVSLEMNSQLVTRDQILASKAYLEGMIARCMRHL